MKTCEKLSLIIGIAITHKASTRTIVLMKLVYPMYLGTNFGEMDKMKKLGKKLTNVTILISLLSIPNP